MRQLMYDHGIVHFCIPFGLKCVCGQKLRLELVRVHEHRQTGWIGGTWRFRSDRWSTIQLGGQDERFGNSLGCRYKESIVHITLVLHVHRNIVTVLSSSFEIIQLVVEGNLGEAVAISDVVHHISNMNSPVLFGHIAFPLGPKEIALFPLWRTGLGYGRTS